MNEKMKQENERIQKRIDKIMEEDNDDEMLMKELEELAGPGAMEDYVSEGGNTSEGSMMGDTPSNYNAMN